jgi:hypothetical protein
VEELLACLKEMEELLQFPGVPGHVEAASKLATIIARGTSDGRIANLAMKAVSEARALRASALPLKPDRSNLNATLWRLRLALQQAQCEARQTSPANVRS